jgi:hypothetical protein
MRDFVEIITCDPGSYHVSLDTVWEFEEAILSDDRVVERKSSASILREMPNSLWSCIYRLLSYRKATKEAAPGLEAKGHRFAVTTAWNLRKTMPYFLAPRRKALYLFDAWPSAHKNIRIFSKACRLDHLFLSSSQASQRLSEILPRTSCHWVPEGINPERYRSLPPDRKDIDVLQLGRRYDAYHNEILAPLASGGATYLYEKAPGQLIFPTREAYIEGLARTKISVCVPVSITHPQRSGGIETMTVRYLQSMLSKCLIVGHAPRETIELFGYNPVIEIDPKDPGAQLLSLLDNLASYEALIEKNYENVCRNHTWKNRWKQILVALS